MTNRNTAVIGLARPFVVVLLASACFSASLTAGATAAPSPNDNFANAQALRGSPDRDGDIHDGDFGITVGASKETGEPDHAGDAGGASLWYSWTPTRSRRVEVDTCDEDTFFDTLLAVYTASGPVPPFSNLTWVASNDDSDDPECVRSGQSFVRFNATAGATYYIALDGFEGATGGFWLFLWAPTPGSSRSDGVTRREYIARADPICARYIRAARKLHPRYRRATFDKFKFGKAARILGREGRHFGRMIVNLGSVKLPRENASVIKRWLRGLRSQQPISRRVGAALKKMDVGPLTRKEIRRFDRTARKVDRVSARTKRLVRHYGFKHCDDA
ncbi:MAG: hypothetical protein FVQ78_05140 [Solirubrobacterales bacterium]|nr:hypothetical protein [Solirubrobacterales bacterium]